MTCSPPRLQIVGAPPTCRTIILALVVCAGGLRIIADDAPSGDARERELAESFLEFAREQAASYEIALASEPDRPLTLEPEPIIRWSNPAAGSIHGGLFLWTDRGCPLAAGAIFKWYSPHRHGTHELHSLADEALVGRRDGQEEWRPEAAGVERRPVPGAPAPADSAAARLREMRTIAREFSAEKTDRGGQRQELRLLPQPIYRYRGQGPDVPDGAVFVFVQGTDPEVLLLVEARRDGGRPRWEYAPARMNSVQFRLTHGDDTVWEAPTLPWSVVHDRTRGYTAYRQDPDDADQGR